MIFPVGVPMEDFQRMLQDLGYSNVTISGVYDFETGAAIIDFKRAHGLPPTFDVDPATYSSMLGAAASLESGAVSRGGGGAAVASPPVDITGRTTGKTPLAMAALVLGGALALFSKKPEIRTTGLVIGGVGVAAMISDARAAKRLAVGDPCSSSSQCASGNCINGACAPAGQAL